uniref:Natural killer cell receptor 2B4 immunoglobulin domain-containing protein n=1 Tax=Oryzias latipes TaxID=8090 RepID=A0A3P9M9A1_ORYLA
MNSLSQLSPFCFTEKVLLGSKGSSVVLSPGDAETNITSITWKHGDRFVAVWAGEKTEFFFRCNDGCSLKTETGELTINDVKMEDSGEYTPEINGKILSALKLQVLSPVPKPNITHDCDPEKTKCTLTCSFDRTDDLGDVEVFWILDDRREKGTELQITKDTKEETFICSLKNPVSSENSTELKNPLFSGGVTSLFYLLILLVIPLIGVGVFLIFHFKSKKTFSFFPVQLKEQICVNYLSIFHSF